MQFLKPVSNSHKIPPNYLISQLISSGLVQWFDLDDWNKKPACGVFDLWHNPTWPLQNTLHMLGGVIWETDWFMKKEKNQLLTALHGWNTKVKKKKMKRYQNAKVQKKKTTKRRKWWDTKIQKYKRPVYPIMATFPIGLTTDTNTGLIWSVLQNTTFLFLKIIPFHIKLSFRYDDEAFT